jgi:hypothetical protein
MRSFTSRFFGAVAGAAVLLTACSASHPPSVSSAVVSHFDGLPTGVTSPRNDQGEWVAPAGPGLLYVITGGRGRCPRLPSSVTASGADRVVIKTAVVHEGGADCTITGGGLTTSVVRLPAQVDANHTITVQLDSTLPAELMPHA